MEWQSSSGGAAEQTEAKRERKILLGRWLGPVLPEGGADLKIGGVLFIEKHISWEGKKGSRDNQGNEAMTYNSHKAWTQPCPTDAVKETCRGQKRIELVCLVTRLPLAGSCHLLMTAPIIMQR